jgi:hypothetical protein
MSSSASPTAVATDVHPAVAADTEEAQDCFDQWVDYLPHHHQQQLPLPDDSLLDDLEAEEDDDDAIHGGGGNALKRASLDVTESHLTESQDSSHHYMDTNWPDSSSLEGCYHASVVPNVLLVEHDPFLQQELLLSDPSMHPLLTEEFASSLQDVLTQRRLQLAASMAASQRTRRCLEPHIQQRASLAAVLQSIEGSSATVHEHVLHPADDDDDAMEVEEDEEMLACGALDLSADEPPPP